MPLNGRTSLVLALPLGVALAACKPAQPPAGDSAATAAAARPATPRTPNPPFAGEVPAVALKRDVTGEYGGNLLLPLIGNPKTFNPILANETSSTDVLLPALVAALVDFNRITEENVPFLLESWSHGPDYTTWEFKLREGARWSDGQPITADDLLFSYEVVMDEKIPTAIRSGFEGDSRPTRVEKVDERTFRFTLGVPNHHFYINVGNLYPVPRHVLEPLYRAGKFVTDAYNTGTPPAQIVTSGPYRVREFAADQRIVLERNPHFFAVDRDGKRLPYIDTVTFLVTPNTDTSMLKFKSGEVDALEPFVYPKDYQALKADAERGGFSIQIIGPSHNTNFYWFNQNPGSKVDPQKLKWFRDRRFRRALAHAVDREGMVRTVLLGLGKPLYGWPSPANTRWHNPNVTRFEYDPDRARAQLEEMGFKDRNGDGVREDPDGKPFEFRIATNSNNTDRVRMLTLLVEDFNKIGIKATPDPMDFNALVEKIRTSYDYEAALLGLSTAVPPVPMLSSNVLRSSGITHYWHPNQSGKPGYEWEATIDRLYDSMLRTDDYPTMKKIYDEIQTILVEEQCWTTTVILDYIVAYKNRIKNCKPSTLRPSTYWNLDELWLDPAN